MAKQTSCQKYGHTWSATEVDGWFGCTQVHCGHYAVCPACLGVRVNDAQVHFCDLHVAYAGSVEHYPIAERVPVDLAPACEQQALW